MTSDSLLERPVALENAHGVEGSGALCVSGSAKVPLLTDKAVCRQTRLR